MLNKLGGRKIIFGMLFLAVGVTLALVLGDLPGNLMQFMIFLSAGFFIGNGAEHAAGAVKEKAKSTKDATEVMNHIALQLNDLQQKNGVLVDSVTTSSTALNTLLKKVTPNK